MVWQLRYYKLSLDISQVNSWLLRVNLYIYIHVYISQGWYVCRSSYSYKNLGIKIPHSDGFELMTNVSASFLSRLSTTELNHVINFSRFSEQRLYYVIELNHVTIYRMHTLFILALRPHVTMLLLRNIFRKVQLLYLGSRPIFLTPPIILSP